MAANLCGAAMPKVVQPAEGPAVPEGITCHLDVGHLDDEHCGWGGTWYRWPRTKTERDSVWINRLALDTESSKSSSFSAADADLRRLRKAFFDAKSDNRAWKDRHKTPSTLFSLLSIRLSRVDSCE